VVDRHDLAALARCWLDDYRWIAHWKLDETEGNIAHDSAGDNDGILNGDPIWRPSDGKIQGALELDGVNDYVSTPFVLNPAEGPFSVFMWVKGGVPGQAILSQASGSDWLSTIPPMGWIMTNCGGSLVTQIVITDGQWHRLGLTWDGTNRILYVDEKVVASDTPAGIDAALGGLHIGANNALSAGLFWSGLIDDVRIYDCATEP
ncbi:MAG: LamG domain-containing protein, partial [Phycisphaerales bacterium]